VKGTVLERFLVFLTHGSVLPRLRRPRFGSNLKHVESEMRKGEDG